MAEAPKLKDRFRRSSDRRMVAHVTPNFPLALARPVKPLWILSDIPEFFRSKPPRSVAFRHFPADFQQISNNCRKLMVVYGIVAKYTHKGGQNFRFVTCESPLSGWLEVVCGGLVWVGLVYFDSNPK